MFSSKHADKLISRLNSLDANFKDNNMKRWIHILSADALISVDSICKIISTESTTCGTSPVTTHKIEFYGNGSITYPYAVATFNDANSRSLTYCALLQWICMDSSGCRIFNLCDTVV